MDEEKKNMLMAAFDECMFSPGDIKVQIFGDDMERYQVGEFHDFFYNKEEGRIYLTIKVGGRE